MSEAVELVRAYVKAAQTARSSGSSEDWDLVRSYLDDDVLTRLAGDGTGSEWIIVSKQAVDGIARLRRPAARAARLQTTTVDVFGAGGRVVVEQVSTYQRPDGSVARKPICFVFDVREGRIASISIYRNDSEPGESA